MPASLDLYGAKTGNCLRTAIALEEAGLTFTPRPLELSAGAHRAPAHLALNPRGRVPVRVVPDADAAQSPALVCMRAAAATRIAATSAQA